MSSPHSPDSRLAWALVISIIVILWMAFASPLHAQTSLSESLQTSEEMLNLLVTRLAERQKQVEQLQTDLQATQTSLDALSTQLAEQEKHWQAYRSEVTELVTGLEREARRAKVWAGIFLGGTIAGAIGCLVLALR